MRVLNQFWSLLLALELSGCLSYTITQRNVFVDEDGFVTTVDYGRADSDHVNTFVSPATGQEMEFKSRLLVKAELPDGDTIKAWQCMNFLTRGTMYETDDREWKVFLDGFHCSLFHLTDETPPRYREVYRGVQVESPDIGVKKDERWRDISQFGKREYRHPSETRKVIK